MNKINFIERVPQQINKNGISRYGIYNSDGTLRNYAYILKEDGAVIEGTKVNKALFDLIDNNLDTANGKADISTKCWTLSNTLSYTTNTSNFLPTEWTYESQIKYTSGDMIIGGNNPYNTNTQIDKAFDGDETTGFYAYMETSNVNSKSGMFIDLGEAIQINKFASKVEGTYIKLVGSNNAPTYSSLTGWGFASWDYNVLYEYEMNNPTGTRHITDVVEEITIQNPAEYRYYGVLGSTDGDVISVGAYEFYPLEWKEKCYITTFDFDIGEIEEDTTMEVRTTATSYRNLLRFNDRDIFITNIIASNKYFELLYNGNTFDATQLT